jgi:hypothetical protein
VTWVALALVCLGEVAPAIAQVADDRLIVPGQRIGSWTLDMTIADLLRTNGPRVPIGTVFGSWEPIARNQPVTSTPPTFGSIAGITSVCAFRRSDVTASGSGTSESSTRATARRETFAGA